MILTDFNVTCVKVEEELLSGLLLPPELLLEWVLEAEEALEVEEVLEVEDPPSSELISEEGLGAGFGSTLLEEDSSGGFGDRLLFQAGLSPSCELLESMWEFDSVCPQNTCTEHVARRTAAKRLMEQAFIFFKRIPPVNFEYPCLTRSA